MTDLKEEIKTKIEEKGLIEPRVRNSFFTAVYGSHLYGFHSQDSDIDVKIVYIRPTREVLISGLTVQRYCRPEEIKEGEIDSTSLEIEHFLRQIVRSNCNYHDLIIPGNWVIGGKLGERFKQLQRILIGSRSRKLLNSYLKTGEAHYDEAQGSYKAKDYLHALRSLMTAVHLLKTENSLTDICELAENFPGIDIEQALAAKRNCGENSTVEKRLKKDLDRQVQGLLGEARDLLRKSRLPAEPMNIGDIEDYLLRIRKEN